MFESDEIKTLCQTRDREWQLKPRRAHCLTFRSRYKQAPGGPGALNSGLIGLVHARPRTSASRHPRPAPAREGGEPIFLLSH
jgi:hypothetical protein